MMNIFGPENVYLFAFLVRLDVVQNVCRMQKKTLSNSKNSLHVFKN